jgi:hypothetical protein
MAKHWLTNALGSQLRRFFWRSVSPCTSAWLALCYGLPFSQSECFSEQLRQCLCLWPLCRLLGQLKRASLLIIAASAGHSYMRRTGCIADTVSWGGCSPPSRVWCGRRISRFARGPMALTGSSAMAPLGRYENACTCLSRHHCMLHAAQNRTFVIAISFASNEEILRTQNP